MKIGIIHPIMDVMGGAEYTTLSLLDVLSKTEDSITLYTTSENVTISKKIKVRCIKKKNFPIGWKLQRVLDIQKLFNAAKKEEIIIVSSGNLVLSRVSKKIIIYAHSSFESELNIINRKNKGIFKIYHDIVKKRIDDQIKQLCNKSVLVISNSFYTKEKIKQNFNKNSIVIYPPVKIHKIQTEVIRKSGIVTISRYSPEKNLEFTLEILKKININSEIIGNAIFRSQFEFYNKLKRDIEKFDQIDLRCNIKKEDIEKSLKSAKIYFHSSKETFGISVIESIAAGCIPIVPDNSAHKETVPFKELRYKENDLDDAQDKIGKAMNGEFDKYLTDLQNHSKQYTENNFHKAILQYILKVKETV